MASVFDADLRVLAECGTDVAISHRDGGQRADGVDLPYCLRGSENGGTDRRDRAEELVIQTQLDGDRLLLGTEDLFFERLEVGRDVALRVRERLLADVIRRSLGQVRFRDLDVVAEDRVVADLERADAGTFALARFDLEQDGFRNARDGARSEEHTSELQSQ